MIVRWKWGGTNGAGRDIMHGTKAGAFTEFETCARCYLVPKVGPAFQLQLQLQTNLISTLRRTTNTPLLSYAFGLWTHPVSPLVRINHMRLNDRVINIWYINHVYIYIYITWILLELFVSILLKCTLYILHLCFNSPIQLFNDVTSYNSFIAYKIMHALPKYQILSQTQLENSIFSTTQRVVWKNTKFFIFPATKIIGRNFRWPEKFVKNSVQLFKVKWSEILTNYIRWLKIFERKF